MLVNSDRLDTSWLRHTCVRSICNDSFHCETACPVFASVRELTATKWYSTTVSIASAPSEFARLYNVVLVIILPVRNVKHSEHRGKTITRSERYEPDVVVAV